MASRVIDNEGPVLVWEREQKRLIKEKQGRAEVTHDDMMTTGTFASDFFLLFQTLLDCDNFLGLEF